MEWDGSLFDASRVYSDEQYPGIIQVQLFLPRLKAGSRGARCFFFRACLAVLMVALGSEYVFVVCIEHLIRKFHLFYDPTTTSYTVTGASTLGIAVFWSLWIIVKEIDKCWEVLKPYWTPAVQGL